MRILSREDASLWCGQNNIVLNDRGLPERIDAPVHFKIPEDANKRVGLVSDRMQAFNLEPIFLVWFDDWAVWPSGQRMHIFDRLRMSYGETRPLAQSPGHVFDQSEFEDAVSFVTLAVLMLWDCYVVTPKRGKLLFFSHDEFGLMKGIDTGTT
jgi:hypothetical protein